MKKILHKMKNSKYAKNTAVLMLDSTLKILVGFLFTVLIARFFGPGKFGKVNYVLAVVELLQVLVLFGFEDIVLKDLGFGNYSKSMILRTGIFCRLCFAAIYYVLGFPLFFFFLGQEFLVLYSILGLQLFLYVFYLLKQWFQIQSLNQYPVIASQIGSFVYSLFRLGIILFSIGNLAIYSWALVLSLFCEIFSLIFFYRKNSYSNKETNKIDLKYAKQLLKNSIPLVLQNFAILIYMKIDQLMIGKMLPMEELGIYSIGVTVSQTIYFFPGAIINAYYPRIVKKKRNGEDYKGSISDVGAINILLCFLFAVACTILAPIFIKLIFGEAYVKSGNVIQIHAWAGIFVALSSSNGYYLVWKGLQRYSLYATLIGAICNVTLNFIFIPIFGIYGAAITTILSQMMASFGAYFFFKDKESLELRTECLRKVVTPRTYKRFLEILKK